MPTAKSATKNKKAKRSYSLISDETFQQMHTALTVLRTSLKRRVAAQYGAAIAGTVVDLRPSDLIVAAADLFPASLLNDHHLQLRARSKTARPSPSGGAVPVISPSDASAVLTIAAGTALGRLTSAGDSVIVAFGTTDEATHASWTEALQLVGTHRLPILFVLLPGDAKHAARIGSAAASAGVITVPVDLADVVAMYRVGFESLARARRRTGATLIVSTPYRLEDDRPQGAEDPLKKLDRYLAAKGIPLKRK